MLTQRQQSIFDYIKQEKSVSREQIQQNLSPLFSKNSKATLLRDLDFLMKEGFVSKKGTTKSAVYIPSIKSKLLDTIDVKSYFSTEERSGVQKKFNFDIFDHLSNLFNSNEITCFTKLNQEYITHRSELSPVLLRKEFERLTIEFAWKSSKIEGNTYTLLDTERLIKENISAVGKTKAESKMILNHKTALDYVLEQPEYFQEVSVAKIIELHQLLTDDLEISFDIRKNGVGIIGTDYKPLDNEFQIKEALQKLADLVNKIEFPLEKALILVLMISYIQPFEDGNKRTARILANAVLMAYNYCPLSYRSVDEIEYKKAIILFYEQNSAFYFKQLFLDQFKQAIEKYFH